MHTDLRYVRVIRNLLLLSEKNERKKTQVERKGGSCKGIWPTGRVTYFIVIALSHVRFHIFLFPFQLYQIMNTLLSSIGQINFIIFFKRCRTSSKSAGKLVTGVTDSGKTTYIRKRVLNFKHSHPPTNRRIVFCSLLTLSVLEFGKNE